MPRARLPLGMPTRSPRLSGASRTRDRTTRVRAPRGDSRLPLVLDAAALNFAAKGYEATSIRDIVRSVGMLPGSLYCHFANKEALLAAVYTEGVRRITQAVTEAVETRSDPWERLQAACAAHLKALVEPSAYAKVVITVEPGRVPALQDTMVALRNGYERMFSALIDDLPLPPRAPRRALRLMLLGAMNWAPNWYRSEGAHPPSRIARDFVSLIRLDAERASGSGCR